MVKQLSSRVALLAATGVVSAGAVASAQTQYTLQKSNSISLSTLFATGTGYGSNPLSIAVDSAGNAYVGGYNSSAAVANIGIVKISDALSGTPTVAGLPDSQFSSPASRGTDALASVGGDIYRLHESGTATTGFIERLTPTGTSVWKTTNPGNGVRVSAMAIDPLADVVSGPTPAPAVAFLGFSQGRRATLKTSDGTVDYTFSGGAKPGAIINTASTPALNSNWRALNFDAAGDIITGSPSGVGAGKRVVGDPNRFTTLDGATNDATSRVILKGTVLDNVGNGVSYLNGAATDQLIVFSARAIGSGAGASQTLTNGLGGGETINSKYAQIRQIRGQPGYLTQTQLTGAEDGLGSEYAGEVKNFSTGVDANGNPALFVVDYLTRQLDIYTIEPRYSVDADSTWSSPAAWTLGIVPNTRTTNATFAGGITAPRTVTLDGERTVKQLKFDNAANRYTINGTSAIRLTAPANDSAPAYISVLNGSHTVNAPIVLGSNTRIDVTNATDTITLGAVDGAGFGLTKRGAGKAAVAHVRVSALAVNEGTLALKFNGTESGISRIGGLTLGTNPATGTPTVGIIDIGDNGLIFDYAPADVSPFDNFKAAIAANLIITSAPLGTSNTIGVIDYATLGAPARPTFTTPGLTIDATSVFVRYTLRGDSDVDRDVDFDDLLALARNYNKPTGALYFQGDNDGDGDVDFDDLLGLARNYGKTVAPIPAIGSAAFQADWALAQALVPEPTMMLGLLAALPMLRRRRA